MVLGGFPTGRANLAAVGDRPDVDRWLEGNTSLEYSTLLIATTICGFSVGDRRDGDRRDGAALPRRASVSDTSSEESLELPSIAV